MTENFESVTGKEYCHLTGFLDDGIKLSTSRSFVTTVLVHMVLDMCQRQQFEFMEVDYVDNMEYIYCGSKLKMKVDPKQDAKGRESQVTQSKLRRVPEQRKLITSNVLDNGLVFQHELWIIPESSNILVARSVRIWSATPLGP